MSTTRTLRDVADAADVSPMTVSRVLNNRGPVAAATRDRVLEAAERLGYRGNALTSMVMSHLRRGSSGSVRGNIGFLTGDRTEFAWRERAFYSQLYDGASARARKLGCVLDPLWLRSPELKEKRLNDILLARGIQGVLVGTWVDGHADPDLDWSRIKGVAIGYTIRTRLHRVSSNQLQAMRLALGKLRENGYQRVGVVYSRQADERVNHAWSAALASWRDHLPPEQQVPPLILESDDDPLDTETFRSWHRDEHVDAALMQGGIIRHLTRQGIRFPEEVPVASLERHRDQSMRVAGIDRNFRFLGSVAMDILTTAMFTASPGLPAVPLTTLLDTHWQDGTTLPGPPA